MLGLNPFLVLPILLSVAVPGVGGLLAYGPAPGLELIPYFLSLVAWAGLACAAILLAPLSALLRRIRRARGAARTEPKTVSTPQSSEEGRDSG